MAYYGTRISDHMTLTEPEKYLICHDVPICRTGWQKYIGSEIGAPEHEFVEVYRSEEEVCNPQAIASFEGMTVTDGHPPARSGNDPAIVAPDNDGTYNRGHIQNVRKGKEPIGGEIPVLGDLFIKDANLIGKIDGGLREVSCGYGCRYIPWDGKKGPEGYPAYKQTEIRGNHVAVVPDGRAGDRVAIRDSAPEIKQPTRRPIMVGKGFWDTIRAIGFSVWAKDAKPEEIAEALKEKDEKDKPAEDCHCKDCAAKDAEISSLKEALEKKKDEKPAEDVLDSLEKELEKGAEDLEGYTAGGEFHPIRESDGYSKAKSGEGQGTKTRKAHDEEAEVPVLSPEEQPDNPLPASMDTGIALALVKKMKPIICGMKDPAERKHASDALVASVRDYMRAPASQPGSYGQLLRTKKPEERPAMDADTMADNYKKEIDASRAKKRGITVVTGGK